MASEMTSAEIRERIDELSAQVKHDDEHRVTAETRCYQDQIDQLTDILMERGHACFACMFGAWPKSAQCKHG